MSSQMYKNTYILTFSYSYAHYQLCLHPISLFCQDLISSASVSLSDCATTACKQYST